jgi:phage-related protein
MMIDNLGIYIGFTTLGTATTSYTNTLTNTGTAAAYPIITIKRAGGTSAIVEWVKNETTGKRILINYSLQDGETLTIDLRPGRRAVTSSYYGDVWRAILRGSDFADFTLLPGANLITVLVANSGATVTPTMRWRPAYWSTDGVA